MKLLTGHTESIFAIAFSHDGKRLASASLDNTVKFWDLATASESRSFSEFDFTGRRTTIAFMADGEDLLACSHGIITGYSVATGAKTQLFNCQTSPDIATFALSPDCTQLAAVKEDCTIELWDLKKGDVLPGSRTGNLAAYSPDGKTLASAFYDGTISLWDLNITSTVLTSCSGHLRAVSALAFSPNGEQLASASVDGSVRIQNPATGIEIVPPRRVHSDIVTTLAYSPNGDQLASGSSDKTIKLWGTAAGYKLQRELDGHSEDVTAVAYSGDGKQIVSVSRDGEIRLWDPATGLGRLAFDTRRPFSNSALSPNGKQVALDSEGNTEVWDLDKDLDSPVWRQTSTCDGREIAFSPDGTQLVCLSDEAVQFYDAAIGAVTGAPLQLPIWSLFAPRVLRFSADGRMLYTNRGCIDIRPLPLEKASFIELEKPSEKSPASPP